MNILFFSHRIPFPPNKGEKIRTYNQVKQLVEAGHKIQVYSPIEDELESNFATELSELFNIKTHCTKLNTKTLRLMLGLLTAKPLSVSNFYNNQLQQTLDSIIQQANIDAIICTSSAMAEYVFQSKTLNSLPKKPMLLMDFMDLDSDKWRQYSETSTLPMKWIYQREAKLLSQYEQQITQDFDCSFFIADAEVELFREKATNSGKVLTLGNGLDTSSFSPPSVAPQNDDPVFIFTGVMDYKPNVDAVIWFVETVWQKVLSSYPKARFIIAGMTPSSSVQRLEDINGIEVTGFVDDILPYYHQADYFIAPFRLARGVQNKILQAFACGLPVISTPMGAEGIECSDGESILLANSSEEFLSSIQQLESDHELKTSIKHNALQLIHEKYSWEGKLQVLDNVLAGKL